MLVLTRNTNESFFIHTAEGIIEVSVNQIKGGQVKLGIEAPKNIRVIRSELSDQFQSDWRRAPVKSPSFFSSLSLSKF